LRSAGSARRNPQRAEPPQQIRIDAAPSAFGSTMPSGRRRDRGEVLIGERSSGR
jgi:hypothetical protein